MADESDSRRKRVGPHNLVRVEAQQLSEQDLCRIGLAAESLVGRSRAREFMIDAVRRYTIEEETWHTAEQFADRVIRAMVESRIRELEARTPSIFRRLEEKASEDRVTSNVLGSLRAGMNEQDVRQSLEISVGEYRAALRSLYRLLPSLGDIDVGPKVSAKGSNLQTELRLVVNALLQPISGVDVQRFEQELRSRGQDPAIYSDLIRQQLLEGVTLSDRLACLADLAERVWGDREAARQFLTRPHPMLDGRTPVDAAITEDGARRVERILANLMHGLPV
ncbi:MAG TPA: MbcA/ParS/Xre antitoxin family protein [Terriglobales bacterium]|nr:MbcA/ParS/Xre antitoxin family protein [Terriglobales bacterium]